MSFDTLDLLERLLIVRRGTSYFAQRIAELSDHDFDGETTLSGWSRRHLLAHVGYNAAALCRLMDWAATGIQTPMYESPEQRGREIDEGATLSPAALRNLFDHTVARLDEKWRHLPDSAWDSQVRTAQGRLVPASETLWMRTREVWIHAVDLGNGGRFGDFPEVVIESLLADVVGMWRRKNLGDGLSLRIDGCASIAVQEGSELKTEVSGPAASVARWATGRGEVGISVNGLTVAPPTWL